MSTLIQTLEKLVGWAGDGPGQRIVVARPALTAARLPAGVQLKKRPLSGERTIIKGQRWYGNARGAIASWPDCDLHEINNLKLACVVAGHTDFHVGEHSLRCGAGHFIALPPGTPHPVGTRHCVDLEKSRFCEICYFRLVPGAVQCWSSHYEDGPRVHQSLGEYVLTQAHIVQLFGVMMEEMINDPSDAKRGAAGEIGAQLLQPFLQMVARETAAGKIQSVRPRAMEDAPRPATDDFSTQLQQYIQAHLYERPTLESAAHSMYLSRAQFARCVKAETGCTFGELLANQRLESVKNLLRDSDWSIEAIADLVGYHSPHTLQTLLRRDCGLTLAQYRRQARHANAED